MSVKLVATIRAVNPDAGVLELDLGPNPALPHLRKSLVIRGLPAPALRVLVNSWDRSYALELEMP